MFWIRAHCASGTPQSRRAVINSIHFSSIISLPALVTITCPLPLYFVHIAKWNAIVTQQQLWKGLHSGESTPLLDRQPASRFKIWDPWKCSFKRRLHHDAVRRTVEGTLQMQTPFDRLEVCSAGTLHGRKPPRRLLIFLLPPIVETELWQNKAICWKTKPQNWSTWISHLNFNFYQSVFIYFTITV